MSEPVISIHDLSFSYGDVAVIKHVCLDVFAGEFLGIVGPNAGGKSTLLKLILGLENIQAGSIKVFARSPKKVSRRIGYVPQYPKFERSFPVTVEQVVLMGRLGLGSIVGRYSRKDKELAHQALKEVEANNLVHRQIGTLSGGQLQRVLLARALVGEPDILILDEPTANIDQRLESDIFDLLKHLNERMTILVVSHDIAFISSYVNRVACLSGTLVCHNTKDIDGNVIQNLYGEHISMVAHQH